MAQANTQVYLFWMLFASFGLAGSLRHHHNVALFLLSDAVCTPIPDSRPESE
jgi:sulfur relay (sulfurtransferase) complex TusBCD TusD component (DsrE family)